MSRLKELVASDTDDTDDDGEQEEAAIADDVDLKNLSFAELQELKERLGVRGYREVLSEDFKSKKRRTDFKRANKNRPREESSKRPPRPKIAKPTREVRDPRFDDRAGEYKPDAFRHHYEFLDDVKRAEVQKLKKKMRKAKDPETKKQFRDSLLRLRNQLKEQERKDKAKEDEEAEKKRNIERLRQGQAPFFKNKAAKRSDALEEKFWDLKQQGKLDNYMKKKRRRVAAEDKKAIKSLS